jgi:hypothetical protein
MIHVASTGDSYLYLLEHCNDNEELLDSGRCSEEVALLPLVLSEADILT